MIKVELLDSIDGVRRPLTSIEGHYLERINSKGNGKAKNPLERLLSLSSLKNGIEKDILHHCIDQYDHIILARPSELQALVSFFNDSSRGWNTYIEQTHIFKKELLKAYGYQNKFRSETGKGIWLSEILNIRACPYCNAQYTLTTINREGKKKAKFQYDHFFPKDKYPYLSLSLYNLIPSCANCNHNKRNSESNISLHYHPYHNSLADRFKFNINPESALLEQLKISEFDTTKIKINLVTKNASDQAFIDEHDRIYDISGIYNKHVDVAEELLVKATQYSRQYKRQLSAIEGLFPDQSTFLRYLISNYGLESEILKRPLSKFTQDIAQQLNLTEI